MSPDPYVYPGTSVLRNHRGIQNQAELTAVEAEVTAFALAGLANRRIPGGYDLAHLQAFHRAIFGDLYPWAGEVRTVAIARTGRFCLPEHITSYGAEVFGRLAREKYLRGLDHDAFLVGFTYFYGEINALHPFREGNGRSQRAFLGQLALDADPGSEPAAPTRRYPNVGGGATRRPGVEPCTCRLTSGPRTTRRTMYAGMRSG